MIKKHVLIIGGGFAGLSCATHLAKYPNVHITLIDKNNFNEFKPLLYQVATAALSIQNVVSTLRLQFLGKTNVDIKMAEVTAVDPHRLTVSTKQGQSYTSDFLVFLGGYFLCQKRIAFKVFLSTYSFNFAVSLVSLYQATFFSLA